MLMILTNLKKFNKKKNEGDNESSPSFVWTRSRHQRTFLIAVH